MRVYQAADRRWIFWTDSDKLYFDTEGEARKMANKVRFVKALQAQTTILANLGVELSDLAEVYADREYGDGNAIEAADVEPLGLTVEQVEDMVGLVPTLLTFLDNETNRAILNNMRTDV